MSEHYVDIAGQRIPLNIAAITIQEWVDLQGLIQQNRKDEAAHEIFRLTLKVVGERGSSLSLIYLPLFVAKVIELASEALSPGSVESELDEIMRRSSGENPS